MNKYNNEIYVLDDDPVFAMTLKKVLENRLNITTTIFHDPVTMLDNLSEHRPSVIIIDFYGPLKGDKIIEKVRDKENGSLVIMISGDENRDNMLACLKSGANNVILKKNIMAVPSLIETHLKIRTSRSAQIVK